MASVSTHFFYVVNILKAQTGDLQFFLAHSGSCIISFFCCLLLLVVVCDGGGGGGSFCGIWGEKRKY